ncbi:hypothetical protein [Bacillus sp. ISL-46]|nr:hypothetical protein [Bacillus sp. ISL-46]MBT2723944.1 hypothetical protein [Bacillus sp. ISL-46]
MESRFIYHPKQKSAPAVNGEPFHLPSKAKIRSSGKWRTFIYHPKQKVALAVNGESLK